MKAINKSTKEIVYVWYGANTCGNLRYHINGKSISDKQFDLKYKLIKTS